MLSHYEKQNLLPIVKTLSSAQLPLGRRAILGEAPLWDPFSRQLFWVDIFGKAVFGADLAGGVREWPMPSRPGAIALTASNHLIVALGTGIHRLDLDTGSVTLIVHPDSDAPDNRYNDCTVDQEGRLWVGSLDDTGKIGRGSVFVIEADGGWRRMLTGIGLTNGLAFSPDAAVLYHTDSAARGIFRYDVDGLHLGPPKVFAIDEHGIPDGLAVDAEGGVWSAKLGAGRVVRYDPTGNIDAEVRLGVSSPTSIAFFGANCQRLVITTASIDIADDDFDRGAGFLFAAEDLGVNGLPAIPCSLMPSTSLGSPT
jgi:L-arabinonolactonase